MWKNRRSDLKELAAIAGIGMVLGTALSFLHPSSAVPGVIEERYGIRISGGLIGLITAISIWFWNMWRSKRQQDELKSELDCIKSSIDGMKASIDGMAADMKAGFARLEAAIDRLGSGTPSAGSDKPSHKSPTDS